ncbi:MAG: electron transport complex subunit RsxC [Lewinellaceae bacterium]|nr:electron transport complex subunit RsxC [Phaeodactylibacter sp.]MCB9351260.1 electron transport complex subunit RsxC [Lewinellaceae bacterium]
MTGSTQNGLKEKLLTFRHGVHPEEYKELSNHQRIERMPFVEEYTLPLLQHIGAPSKPLVHKGQRVRRGDLIAEAGSYVSVALHAPVDGTVTDIGLYGHPNGQMLPAIKIRTDPFSTQQLDQPAQRQPEELAKAEFIEAIQRAGIVGLGGAAFPAHVKFNLSENQPCRYLMLNGCECEPFLTCDHRVMVEYAEELIDGAHILQHFIQAEKVYIAIEANKPDAVVGLRAAAAKAGFPVEIIPLQVKYPQGAEKMMISAILGKEVPAGRLPIDVGVLVSNVGSIVALSQYFRHSQPLIERVITVTGPAVRRPANVLVPLGTPMRDLVEFCGGITGEAARILLGGPMMGIVQKSLDTPVVKGTSGILVLTEREVQDIDTFSCIRCGRCLEACPLFLNPARLGLLARKGLWDDMEDINALDCFECGACSYVCPSAIPLVQSIKVGKSMIREKKAREKNQA